MTGERAAGRVRVVLFDLDETLLPDQASTNEALVATGQRSGVPGVDAQRLAADVRRHAGELWRASPTIEYCRLVGISSWEGLWAGFAGDDPNLIALREWAPAYRREAWRRALAEQGAEDESVAATLAAALPDERRRRLVPFPDAVPVLERLRTRYALGLVTNGAPDLQREKVTGAGLARYFAAVVVSGDVGVGKPEPRVFEVALAALGCAPEEAVMVGDTLDRDVAGALRVGVRAVWIRRGDAHSGDDPASEVRPDATISGLEELEEAIEHFGGAAG